MSIPLDPTSHFGPPDRGRVSSMAEGLVGSEILKIAADVRQVIAAGDPVCNLTVGDFAPRQFRIPASLEAGIVRAYAEGETNYPPSDGVPALREAVARFYARRLGLAYPASCILVAGGGRPLIYGAYRALVDAGDRVVYPVPSWNNNHYAHLTGAVGVPVVCGPETDFLPTAAQLAPHLAGARLLTLCSPLNPTGTLFDPDTLAGVCDAVLAENAQRGPGERPLYLLFDHIYWMLTFGAARHATPLGLRPAMARYTVFVDGVSKAFAATGVRVGWAAGPPDVIDRMSGLLGHVGAWAPRPEQVAVARLLDDDAAIDAYHATMKPAVETRLAALHAGLSALTAAGLPVRAIPPRAAIYLTACFDLLGLRTPAGDVLACGDDIRRYLLAEAGLGMVPFSAFGAADDSGWCRLSVGAVSPEEIAAVLPRLEAALRALPARGAPVTAP
ncbi:MAG: aminotransferase class I/II-fold pyridoxal phosphate-dependent enzyme [Candidatus Eisenbacteria bacterium]